MGIWNLGRSLGVAQTAQALQPGQRAQLASPWSPGLTTSILAADWLGSAEVPATREQAMTIPAVAAARNLLCETLAQGVLKAYRRDTEIDTPAWCYRTDSDVSPYHRALWTWDDLLFGGFSVWAVMRSTRGQIGDAVRVPPERWSWGTAGELLIDGEPALARDVIVFLGWDEGLLWTGRTAIRDALDLAKIVSQRLRVPQAHTTLRITDATLELSETEQQAVVDGFAKARRSTNGAVSLLPYGVEKVQDGEVPVSLYENGRNASSLDIARLTGVPATQLEASQTQASLTYETRQGMRVALWDLARRRATAMDARLSMDDVSPKGTRIALDLSHLQPDETGTDAARED